jgi:LPS export ABC transporter protein LptC
MSRPATILALAVLLVSGAACSLDYGTKLADDLDTAIPDSVVYNFVHTVVENGVPRFRLSAERAESFQPSRIMKLTKIEFTEFERTAANSSTERAIVAQGFADSAIFNTETESADLSGNVRVRSAKNGVTMESGFIRWDGQARILESRLETITTISDDDGSRVSGAGFKAFAATKSFTFTERTEGSYAPPGTEAQ